MSDPYKTMLTCLREAREQWQKASEAPSGDDEHDAASDMADAIEDALTLLTSRKPADAKATPREVAVTVLVAALDRWDSARNRFERDAAVGKMVDAIRYNVVPLLSRTLVHVKDNPGDLAAAEALNRTLWELNRLDPENVAGVDALYAGDNTSVARTCAELSPYAHVQAALMVPLIRLAGSVERAEELRYHLADNGESVAYNLRLARDAWAAVDALKDPVEDAVNALYDAARDPHTVTVLDRLTERAGLVWVCGEPCGWRNPSHTDTCDECDKPRPAEV